MAKEPSGDKLLDAGSLDADQLDKKIDAYVDEVWEGAIEDIRSLVRIPSVEDTLAAQPGMPWGPKAHDALVQGLAIASKLGMDAHECEGGRIGYADVAGASDTQIALICHTDVVPEGLGWTVDPFDVTRREGYLIGRGVLDDKGPCVMGLSAVEFVARLARERGERLPYTLRFLVGNNEETNMGDLDWYLKNYDEPAFAFSPDADFPLICGEKGVFHGHFESAEVFGGKGDSRIVEMDGGTVANAIPSQATATVRATAGELAATDVVDVEPAGDGLARLTSHGKGGHASLPEGTVNAIGLLVDYLLDNGVCSADERAFLELQHALCSMGHDGASLGIESSDDKFGALTVIGGTVRTEGGRLRQTMDSRYPTSITDEQIACALATLADAHAATFDVDAVKVPFYIDPESPEVKALLSAYDGVTGKTSKAITIGGGTYARKFTRACAFGPHDPDEVVPGWVGPEHGPDEGISEASLKCAMKVYIHAILNLMQLEL